MLVSIIKLFYLVKDMSKPITSSQGGNSLVDE